MNFYIKKTFKFPQKKLFYSSFNFGRALSFNFWRSFNYDFKLNLSLETMREYNHILIYDNYEMHQSYLGQKLRKTLNLDKKDKNNNKYLVVIPSKEYFNSKLIKRCFKKSKKLINKKYFFINYDLFELYFSLSRSQEIIQFTDDLSFFNF
nr:MAG TPA: hypothetical protein [Caudoviricetes sp.]